MSVTVLSGVVNRVTMDGIYVDGRDKFFIVADINCKVGDEISIAVQVNTPVKQQALERTKPLADQGDIAKGRPSIPGAK